MEAGREGAELGAARRIPDKQIVCKQPRLRIELVGLEITFAVSVRLECEELAQRHHPVLTQEAEMLPQWEADAHRVGERLVGRIELSQTLVEPERQTSHGVVKKGMGNLVINDALDLAVAAAEQHVVRGWLHDVYADHVVVRAYERITVWAEPGIVLEQINIRRHR